MKIKKTINAYNNLLKISNAKNKQFQQYVFNDFLEEQNLRIKQGKSFDINGCKGVIKQLTYPKIKQKFNVVMDKINEANKPVHDDKLKLKIQSYRSSAKDMYPKSRTFTMKIIAVRGMGKTIFLIAFLHSFINRGVVKDEDIYIFCPTFDNQWRSSGFMARNFSCLNGEYAKGKLLVFDDMQLDTKGNKLIETLQSRGGYNKTGIIQREQFTQATAHIEKSNTDFFILIPSFTESSAHYYHEKFMPTLTAKNTCKLGLLAKEKA